MEDLELDDIQGILKRGYKFLPESCYLGLVIEDVAGARAWLSALLDANRVDAAGSSGSSGSQRRLNVAFTAPGLRKLELPEAALGTFVSEFQEGIAAGHRPRLLGDVGYSAPGEWRWRDEDAHLLLMLFAAKGELDAFIAELVGIAGCPRRVFEMRGRFEVREPFGFVDGISQPAVEGLLQRRVGSRETPIKAGEFVLGYPNEFGRRPASPSVAAAEDPDGILPRVSPGDRGDLGRNGTFLVLRQLAQDVAGFRKLVGDDEDLAARMVGRWKDGAPRVRYAEDPGQNSENDFGYHREDRHGFHCPIGAHIRRANPRDSLADANGLSPEAARAIVNQHRIIRRGRVYELDGERGLLFLCLNANLERQFEFIQHSWIMNPSFGGLEGETDPLLGNAASEAAQRLGNAGNQTAQPLGNAESRSPRHMTIARSPAHERIENLGQFVTVKGGGYFFLPGLTALRYLATPIRR